MTFGLRVLVCAVATLLLASRAISAEESSAAVWDLTGQEASRLFMLGQFAELDAKLNDWTKQRARLPDGRWKISAYGDKMQKIFSSFIQAPETANKTLEDLRKWRQLQPQSPFVAITEAFYWEQLAWNNRGIGASSTVTKEGAALFRENMDKALALLQGARPYSISNPLWHATYIDFMNYVGRPRKELRAAFDAAVKQESSYFPIYSSFAYSLTPKWGGSWDEFASFANEVVKLTQIREGKGYYVRLYRSVTFSERWEFNPFRDGMANWNEMREGFEDIITRYPYVIEQLNSFASFACMAGDGQTYLLVRKQIGDQIVPNQWRRNLNYTNCDARFKK